LAPLSSFGGEATVSSNFIGRDAVLIIASNLAQIALAMSNSLSTPVSLFLDQKEWGNLKHKLEDPFFAQLHRHNLEAIDLLDREKIGGDITKVPWFLGKPGSPSHDIGDRVLKNRVIRGTIAWFLTGDEKYLRFACESLDEACHSPQWIPSHCHGIRGAWLPTGDLLYTMAFGYDALHPFLDASQKERYLGAIREKGLPAYLRGLELKDWWENCNFNWGSALHGNAGLAALLLRDTDPELSARVLAEVKPRLQTIIDYFYEGGAYPEGVMYQCTMLAHLTDFVMPLHRLTGDDLGLSKNQAFHDVITSWQYLAGGDRRPYNFSNVHEGTNEWGCTHVFWWANRLKRPDWTHFQEEVLRDWRDTHGAFFDAESFWHRAAFQKSEPPKTDSLHHFKGIDWVTWKGPKTWLGFRAGFNGDNHNNRDLGHFILGHGKERFLVDPGYGASETSQHNAVTIRGFGETDCSTAPILEATTEPDGFSLICDLSACFPYSLEGYQRYLRLIDDTHLLVIDDIQGRKVTRNSARWHLQTRFPWHREENGNLVIEGPTERLTVWFLSDIDYFQSKDWEFQGPITTLSWTQSYDRIRSIHPMLLTFGNPEVSHRWEDDLFELTLNGKAWRYGDKKLSGLVGAS